MIDSLYNKYFEQYFEDDGVHLLLQEDKKGTKSRTIVQHILSVVSFIFNPKCINCTDFFLVNFFPFFSDVISIDASIASAFNLPIYSEAVMRIIDPASVALDSVEITKKKSKISTWVGQKCGG